MRSIRLMSLDEQRSAKAIFIDKTSSVAKSR